MASDLVLCTLRRLDIDEWMAKIVHSMYSNAQSRVRVSGTLSYDFLVQVGLHQGPVVSPLLFMIVLEALSREIRMSRITAVC